MKILLVNTNRNRQMAPSPVGLAFLCPPLEQAGHEVRLLDLMFSRSPADGLAQALDGFAPDVAGFSIRNVDEQDMSTPSTTLEEIRPLVRAATDRGIRTVVGGAAFSTFPAQMLEYMGADYGIAGQGEVGLPRLLESLEGGDLDETIPGLVWRQGDEVRRNPPDHSGYADTRPDWSKLDHRGYRGSMFQASVVVKTGCALRCSYCDVPGVFGDRFCLRGIDAVIDDLRALQTNHGTRVVFLNDPCFNSPLDHAKQLLEAIARSGLKLHFSSTFVPVTSHYDEEFFALYRRAGGLFAVFGVEALSEAMLRSYAKPFTLEDVFRSADMAHRQGVRVIATLMLGGPGETDATVDEAVAALARFRYSYMTTCCGIRLLPEAPLFERARQEHQVESREELFFPRFYLSPEIDAGQALGRLQAGLRHRPWRMLHMLPAGIRASLARRTGWVF